MIRTDILLIVMIDNLKCVSTFKQLLSNYPTKMFVSLSGHLREVQQAKN